MNTNEKNFINNCIYQNLNVPAPAITVLNDGVYVAFCILKFKVGSESFTEKSYKIFYGHSYKILYSSKAYDVEFTAYCYTSCSSYKAICHRQSHDAFTKRLILQGTIFNPSCSDYKLQIPNQYGVKCNYVK